MAQAHAFSANTYGEARPSPGGTHKCPGTFYCVTASSIPTPALPHQPPTLQPPLLSIPHNNSTIPALSFSSGTKGFSLFTPQTISDDRMKLVQQHSFELMDHF
ncbi:unnamed protein product [Pleuronectes platessa]|uniref:Uncharacterized protein n=1 Tax=Pleuronectes platessa TaxID=8262 RepID=A0A9N7VIR9_PLEPL|nr:unnamed protein product [Pleuronectes platessa]